MLSVIKRARRRRAAARTERAASQEAALLESSGLFALDWYEDELSESFADLEAAIEHYRVVGHLLDISPHPLFEPTAVPKPARGLTPFGAYLSSSPTVAPHPAWVIGPPTGNGAAVLAGVGIPDSQTELTLRLPAGERTVRWGDVEAGWRQLCADRTARRRLNVPGNVRALPAGHRLGARPAPPADQSTLVSIVMPTWNRPEQTLAAIASVQAQSWQHWELLVVDDGSTDDTLARVSAVADEDPRVKPIARPHEGVCAARNAALEAMSGGYVAFLDSDNTWLPDFLQSMVSTMVAGKFPAAFGTLKQNRPGDTRWRIAPTSPELIRVKNQIDMNVLVVRRDIMDQVGGFDPTLRRAVDWDLAIRIVDITPITHIPVIGVEYDHAEDADDRISVSEAPMWAHVVRQRYNIDWEAERSRQRDPELLSVVITLGADAETTQTQLAAALEAFSDRDFEIVLVDCAAPRRSVTCHGPLVGLDSRVRVVGYPRPMSWSFSADIGATDARGTRLVVIDHGVVVQPDSLRALADATSTADLAVPTGEFRTAQAFAARTEAFFAVDGLDAMMHQKLEVADFARRLKKSGFGVKQVERATFEVVTAKSSVYEEQVDGEFSRRHQVAPQG